MLWLQSLTVRENKFTKVEFRFDSRDHSLQVSATSSTKVDKDTNGLKSTHFFHIVTDKKF